MCQIGVIKVNSSVSQSVHLLFIYFKDDNKLDPKFCSQSLFTDNSKSY